MVLRAVARVHLRTGIPISTHTHAATRRGLDQQRIFREEGVDLSRVVIGHSGDTTDLEYLESTAVGRFLPGHGPVRRQRPAVRSRNGSGWSQSCAAGGHAGKLVLSHDASCYNHHIPEEVLTTVVPNWHFRHIPDDVLPALQEAGVSDNDIHADARRQSPRHSGDETSVRVRLFVGGEHAASYEQILAVARVAEESGFDGLFRSDHLLSTVTGTGSPTDAWITLAGLARRNLHVATRHARLRRHLP